MSQTGHLLEREPSLEHYTRQRRVGRGGQGTDHKYFHHPTGVLYAIKVMQYDPRLDADGRPLNEMSIVRESYVSPLLAHAHLLRAYKVFEYEEGFAIIIPYYPHGNLSQKGPNLPELRDATCQILDPLRHLHKRGQIHRDIKPENIPVRSRENEPIDVVVADYGLISLENAVSFCGTRGYTAPEIVVNGGIEPKSRRPQYPNTVDIFALGMLIPDVLNVDVPMMWIDTRDNFNKLISATITRNLEDCDPDDIERQGALLTANMMLRFDPEDRPLVDECLRLPWLSRSNDPRQAVQLACTHSNPSTLNPSQSLPLDDHETVWHTTVKANEMVKSVQNHEKKRTVDRHNPKKKKKHGATRSHLRPKAKQDSEKAP